MPLFLLTQKLFRNTTASFFAALLLALNPFQAKYSVITMPEVPFLFCVFCALYLLYLHLDTKKLLPLIFSSVFIGFASWIRFDGWLFAGGLTLMLFFYDANLRRTLLYGAMNFGPIAIYMLWAKLERGFFTYGIYMSDLEVFYSYQSNPRSYLRMFYEIRSDFAFSFSLAFIAVASVWYCWRHKKHLPLQVLVAVLIATVFYKWANRTLESQGRYLSTALFLLFPFMGYFLSKVSTGSKLLALFFSAVLVFVYIPPIKSTFRQVMQITTASGFYESCEWIRLNKKPTSKYVMNVANFNYCGINALAGIPTSRSYFPHYPGLKKYAHYEKFSHLVLLRLVTKDGYDNLFFQRNLEMDSIFHSSVFIDTANKCGLVFNEKYRNGEYVVYSVGKQQWN
ncbi:MAG: glycosyltransferase family 39 protein [Bacteroidetes bacterium]|nr:glycosyltransferase family 39 protein [Bacteroidota bacterium]